MKFLRRNYLKIGLLVLALLALFFIARPIFFKNTKSQAVSYNSKKDQLVSPAIKDIKDEITLAGSVSANDVANLRFQTSGKLAWVGVRVGDRVKKWQAIASLDKVELRKDLDKELNDYKAALHNFNDVQDTYKTTKQNLLVTDAIQRILDRSQYTLNNQVIDYELSELTLKLSTIYSPIEGVVISVDQPLPGVNITPAAATFTIINPNSIYFKSEIDQEAVTKISSNHQAVITLDSFPDQNIDSQITYISFVPIAGESSTVYEVRFLLPAENSDLSYRLGMDGDAIIELSQSPQALTIPSDAVYDDNGQRYVYVKTADSINRRDITIGIETDTDAEVLKGLSLNEKVVIKQK